MFFIEQTSHSKSFFYSIVLFLIASFMTVSIGAAEPTRSETSESARAPWNTHTSRVSYEDGQQIRFPITEPGVLTLELAADSLAGSHLEIVVDDALSESFQATHFPISRSTHHWRLGVIAPCTFIVRLIDSAGAPIQETFEVISRFQPALVTEHRVAIEDEGRWFEGYQARLISTRVSKVDEEEIEPDPDKNSGYASEIEPTLATWTQLRSDHTTYDGPFANLDRILVISHLTSRGRWEATVTGSTATGDSLSEKVDEEEIEPDPDYLQAPGQALSIARHVTFSPLPSGAGMGSEAALEWLLALIGAETSLDGASATVGRAFRLHSYGAAATPTELPREAGRR